MTCLCQTPLGHLILSSEKRSKLEDALEVHRYGHLLVELCRLAKPHVGLVEVGDSEVVVVGGHFVADQGWGWDPSDFHIVNSDIRCLLKLQDADAEKQLV